MSLDTNNAFYNKRNLNTLHGDDVITTGSI